MASDSPFLYRLSRVSDSVRVQNRIKSLFRTRDREDFRGSYVPVLSPAEFIALHGRDAG
ncbi:MAG: hypothetical protein R6T96_02625 [Longimicrobiales bacterium]